MTTQLSITFVKPVKKRYQRVELFDVDALKNWLVGNDGYSPYGNSTVVSKTYSITKFKHKKNR